MQDKLDPVLQNTIIQTAIRDGIEKHFPIVGKNQTLELVGHLEVNDDLEDWDYPLQKELKLAGQSWSVPIIGTFRLRDNATGAVIDTAKNLKVANIPKMTSRFSMMLDGNEYTTMNQFRLKPGIYTRKKANDELESQFNLAVGYNFKMEMDPAAGIFYLFIGAQRFHLYTLLHALGAPDGDMLKAWGQQIFDKNRTAGLNEEGREIPLMYEKLRRQKLPYEKALEALKSYLDSTRLSVETTEMTIGKGLDRVTAETLLLTSAKLLRVMRGEDKEDERDSLIFKDLYTVDDLLKSYLDKKNPTILKNLVFRTEHKQKIKEIISPDTYTRSIKEFFTQGDLSNPSPQTNPVEMLGEWRKTTIAGTGGIQSEHAITYKTRDVHPSHLGFLDPINTPESGKVGVTLPLTFHVRKEGNDIKTAVVKPDGKEIFITPTEFYKMKIGFPDQHKDGKAKNATVKAMYRGEAVMLKADDVEAYISHPNDMFAWTTNLVPFLGNNSANRALVAAKMVTQSVPLKNPESPLVQVIGETGEPMDQALGDYLKPAVPIGFGDSVVTGIDNNYITIKNAKGETNKIGQYKDFPLNQESFLNSTPTVAIGDKVQEGQVLANLNFNDNSGQFAPGLNVNVAYMPWHGYNYEDGIVVTDSLAKKFTSPVILKKTLQIASGGLLDLEKFQSYFPADITQANIAKLDAEGVIHEGMKVLPGEILIAYLSPVDPTDTERVLKQMNKMMSHPYRNHSLIWDGEHEGTVLYVRKVGNTFNVHVREEQPLVVGDKLAARYGDKGIVTKIIPDSEAPHTKDGTRIDMLVNIHGVPGRMNMGQLLEAAAGKWAAKTGNKYYVENFSDKDHLGDIMSKLKEANIPANEILYDGKTGKPFQKPIFWGNKHYLKLMHVVEHKFKTRDIPGSYDANEQPVHGEQGGQAVDPLQMYAYLAHGAKENLYEFTAVKGQKNDEYWRALQLGFPPPPPQKNFVFDKMLAYIQSSGVNIQKNGSRVGLYPATSKDMLKLSKGELTDAGHMLRGKDLGTIEGGLFDPKITGGMRGENWSHITLATPIPNPLYENAIKSLLKLTGTQFDNIINETFFENKMTGSKLIQYKLKQLDVDKELKETKAALITATPLQVNTLNKRIRYLQTLKTHKLDPADAYMMTIVPVLPPILRPVYPMSSGDIQVSPINKHYRDVALINNQIREIRAAGIDDDEFNRDNRRSLYLSTKALIGLSDPITHTKQKYEGAIATLAGTSPKQGYIHSRVWSKRQDLSARSTITVEPSLGLDEVGLPDAISKSIFKPFIIQEIIRQGYKPVQALDEYKNWTGIADQALNNVIATRPVMLNRAPTLHKHGVQAFKPVRYDGLSIRVNPLVAKGFNFDFDGDAMSVHVPVSEKAVHEAYQMLPSKNLFKAGDKAHMINIDQDYQMGLYYLSLLEKPTGQSFSSIEDAQKKIQFKTDVFALNGKKMTLGQYMINELLPEKLRDYERILDSKTVKKLLEQVYNEYPNDFQKLIDRWKELGRAYAVDRGSTVSITDMVADRTFRDTILKKYDALIKPGMSKWDIQKLYDTAKGEVEKKQNELYGGKNNFYDMVRSGSSGRAGAAITQILSMPGIVMDVHGQPIPYPIKKSWSEGLDSFDYWNAAYGARKGVVDRSVNTQESGALNKELLFNTKNLVVVEEDCGTPEGILLKTDSKEVLDRYLSQDVPGVGKRNTLVSTEILAHAKKRNMDKLPVRSALTCEAENGVCQKCYGLMAGGMPPKIGENVGVIDSQAVTERSTQLTMQTFHTGGVSGGASAITQGFPRLEELLFVPQTIRNEGVLSRNDGIVRNIVDNPAGGKDVYIDTEKYYIPRERHILVSVGTLVHKGDRLTDGSIRPQDMSALKDHLTAQQYVADEMNNVYENKFARKTFETVLRGVSNNAELLSVPKHVDRDWLRGDVVPLTTVKKMNREFVANGKEPIEYKPFFKHIDVLPLHSRDWLSRLSTNRLKQTIQDAAAMGMSSDTRGTDPMPAYFAGLSFGKNPSKAGY
jgi:DNA-directed RNA polymerase subunit beta'